MQQPLQYLSEVVERLQPRMAALSFGLAVYVIPIGIAVLTLIAVAFWEREFPPPQTEVLLFKATAESSTAPLTPEQAVRVLEDIQKKAYYLDTFRSEKPFWFLFSVPPFKDDSQYSIEFPSRHARDLVCWDANTLKSIGGAKARNTFGEVVRIKSGYAYHLHRATQPLQVLCRGTFSGPARLAVTHWQTNDLEASSSKYHRNSGLLDGGIFLLALFVAATAVINREWTYIVFAAWLVANMRMAAISSGWDTQLLEHWVPDDWLYPIRQVTAASLYILTYTLFSRLFRDELKVVSGTWMLKMVEWGCAPLLIASLILPFAIWLPVLWAASGYAVIVAVYLLAQIIWRTRSPVAMWYGASITVTLFASFSEVLSAAFGVRDLIGGINFVTASLSSSLLAALAIGQQMRQERIARLNAEAQLSHAYEVIPVGLFTLNESGAFLRMNPKMEDMLGSARPRRGTSRRWQDYFGLREWERLLSVASELNQIELEISRNAAGDSQMAHYLMRATYTNGVIEGSLQDITDRVQANERLQFLAEHDPLTNVYNRRGIEKILEKAISSIEQGGCLTLGYLDLDRFKLINELFGHAAGDVILMQVCERISGMLSDSHVLGRVGGDEFVIIFESVPLASAHWICRGLVDRIQREHYLAGDSAFQVRGSVGLVEIVQGTTVKDAIAVADRACREAKRGFHDGLFVFERSEELFRERVSEMRLIAHLEKGKTPDGLFLVMQPIMSLRSPYESLNFEVLLRMRDDDGKVISAGPIVTAAENNGRINVIDRWVLKNTLEWIDAHLSHLGRTTFICMNLSGASLNDEHFVRDAFQILGNHHDAAAKLCIEITEGVALHDLDNTKRFIDAAREHGARIALDDFGAGYTSFSYLRELPAELLKIDGMFVKGIKTHPSNLAIIEAIVALAHNLGMRTIAEWAEDAEMVESLATVGVDYVQGYAIAKPVDPEVILSMTSSADLISDPAVAALVSNHLGSNVTVGPWGRSGLPPPSDSK